MLSDWGAWRAGWKLPENYLESLNFSSEETQLNTPTVAYKHFCNTRFIWLIVLICLHNRDWQNNVLLTQTSIIIVVLTIADAVTIFADSLHCMCARTVIAQTFLPPSRDVSKKAGTYGSEENSEGKEIRVHDPWLFPVKIKIILSLTGRPKVYLLRITLR